MKAKLWMGGGVLGAILLFLLGYLLLIGPTRQNAADLRLQAQDLDAQNQALAARLTQVKEQAPEVPEQLEKIADIRARIPADLDIGPLISELQVLAAQAGIFLTAINPETPFYLESVTAEQRAEGQAVEDITIDEDAGVPATSLVATGQTVVIPLTIQGTGSYAQIRAFLNEVEDTQRGVLVKQTQISREGGEDPNATDVLAFSLNSEVFSAPGATWDIREVDIPDVDSPRPATTDDEQESNPGPSPELIEPTEGAVTS